MKYIEKIPEIEEYYPLYIETGWNEFLCLDKKKLEAAIKNSFFAISVYNNSELIGFGRVLSDGVIVKSEFRKKGIGTEIVKQLLTKCNSIRIRYIHLMAAQGTERFYKNLFRIKI